MTHHVRFTSWTDVSIRRGHHRVRSTQFNRFRARDGNAPAFLRGTAAARNSFSLGMMTTRLQAQVPANLHGTQQAPQTFFLHGTQAQQMTFLLRWTRARFLRRSLPPPSGTTSHRSQCM